MSLFALVLRSLRQHAGSSVISALGVALAAGLLMSVFSIKEQARQAFSGGQTGFDAVVGTRGSQLQLVMNAVFHLEASPGNVPWSLYQTLQNHPMVAAAVPYALGDNYYGYRIVGTTEEFFEIFQPRTGKSLAVGRGGRFFDPERREAVVGSFVSAKTGLRVGSTFQPYHGLTFDPTNQHSEVYVVVGVLEPTNTPADRVIWIPIEGVFRLEGHVLRGTGEEYTPEAGQEIPDEHKEASAIMVKLRAPQGGMQLNRTINRQGNVATFAWPIARVMAELFDRLGWIVQLLGYVALMVAVVAALTIAASLLNIIQARRREFAILRALGARRRMVFGSIVLESALVSTAGAVAGWGVYAAILGITSAAVRSATGIVFDLAYYHPILWQAPLGMVLLGMAAALVPAYLAYRTDVAENLNPLA